jgi:hypothetical protein
MIHDLEIATGRATFHDTSPMDGQQHQLARRARITVMRWLGAALLVHGLASCDRKPSEPKPAPAVETEDGSSGAVGRAGKAQPNKFGANAGLLAGLDEALGKPSSEISGPATAAVATTEPSPIGESRTVESDTIEDKPTSTDATAIATPDRVEPTTGVAGASASTRTEKPESGEPAAPSTAASPSGPLALGGIEPLRIGDRVQLQTKAGVWVAGKIVNVQIDGTYDVEHDGGIERGLGDAKLRTQR